MFRSLVVFVLPAFLTSGLLMNINYCFPVHIGPGAKESDGLVQKEFEKRLDLIGRRFDQVDGLFSSHFLYDLYFKNSAYYIFNEETLLNASGSVLYSKIPGTKHPVEYHILDQDGVKRIFEYEKSYKIGSSLRVENVGEYFRNYRSGGEVMTTQYSYDPPAIPGHGQLINRFEINGEACLEARPTILSLIIGYLLSFGIVIGGLQVLKEGLRFISQGFSRH